MIQRLQHLRTTYLKMILFVLLFLFSPIDSGCPTKCDCTENSVTCISKKLEAVPYFDSLLNSPVIIDLSGNSILSIAIDDFSFEKSEQVKEIYLNSSKLTHIEDKAFDELRNLQELYLADNLLNSIPNEFIINNENMILLDISSNYFEEMPMIISQSLEVLAIANSGVSSVGENALSALPNLRVLLLQQNNLKYVHPTIFDNMNHFFFVRMAYNPWQCNCRTVQLFTALTEKKLIDLTEPVQCQTKQKVFIDIYSNKGVTTAFKEQCRDTSYEDYDYMGDEEYLETEDEPLVVKDLVKNIENPTPDVKSPRDGIEIDYFYYTNLYFSTLLFIAMIISLTVGAVCGSCLTYKILRRRVRPTESWNKLLAKSDFA